MKKAVPRSRYFVFVALAFGLCAADLQTKSLAFKRLGWPNSYIHWLWEGFFGFQTSVNEGGLFGLGQGFSLVLAGLSICAAVGIIIWLFPFRAAKDWLLTIALGMITAGILGNLYDRLGLHGLQYPTDYPGKLPGETVHAVRDFIVMAQIGDWHWPNYNIADCSLVGGALLLAWQAFFTKKSETKPLVTAEDAGNS